MDNSGRGLDGQYAARSYAANAYVGRQPSSPHVRFHTPATCESNMCVGNGSVGLADLLFHQISQQIDVIGVQESRAGVDVQAGESVVVGQADLQNG